MITFLSRFNNSFRVILFFQLLILWFGIRPVMASDSLRLINNLRLGVKAGYGYVYPHQNSIRYSLAENIMGIKVTLSTDTYGRSEWDQFYRYPRMGIGWLTTTLGNNSVYGLAHALYLFMDIPLTAKDRRFTSSYQIDFGISYHNKTFDIENNPLNMAISSALNLHVGFELNALYKINNRNEITAGLELTHFSNGKVNTPNLGINSVKVSAGYLYTIRPSGYSRIERTDLPNLRRHNVDFVLSVGSKTDDQITGVHYLISSFVMDYRYRFSYKYSIGAGTDQFYDESLGPNKVADEGGSYTTSDLYQTAVHGSLYSHYSRLTILGQFGYYGYAQYLKYSRLFFRIGFRYQVYQNLFFNFTLKSHYAIADYLEWGIGYRLEKQYITKKHEKND